MFVIKCYTMKTSSPRLPLWALFGIATAMLFVLCYFLGAFYECSWIAEEWAAETRKAVALGTVAFVALVVLWLLSSNLADELTKK